MGYRLSGEKIFIPLRELIGFDTIKWLTEIACGIKHSPKELPSPQAKAFTKCTCAMELWTNKKGKITNVEGWDKIQSIGGVKVETLHDIGDYIEKYRPYGNVLFTTDTIDGMCHLIDFVNKNLKVINENGEDMIIKYTNFDYLKKVYQNGIDGK